jgi:Zn-dependent peptidase ImmA (M78 family)
MINSKNKKFFHNPDEADNWIWRIVNGVGDWVRDHDKSFWYFVKWESIRMGVLKDDLSHECFARLLKEECDAALEERDNQKTLFYNIEKFKYKKHLKDFDKQPDSSYIRTYENELSDLLTKDVLVQNTTKDFSLEQRMHDYLSISTEKESLTSIYAKPMYNGKTATLSLEKYASKRFQDERKPSYTIIFECIDEKVTEEKVDMLYGRFGTLSNTKLFIASSHSFSRQVKGEAEQHNIGLVLVNPQYAVNENCFVLPRTLLNQPDEEAVWNLMLVGEEKNTIPIIIYDKGKTVDSLSYTLYHNANCDKRNLFIPAPILRNDKIEEIAYRIVRPSVNYYLRELDHYNTTGTVPKCVIDPFRIAKNMGLSVVRGKTGGNLGYINVNERKITLSEQNNSSRESERFSVAHEIGHHILHQQVSETAQDGAHAIVPRTRKWLEHHANHFASCLLMPAPIVRELYAIYWKKKFNNRIISPLVLKEPYYMQPLFQQIAGPIARNMNVSLTAVYLRLVRMNLITIAR